MIYLMEEENLYFLRRRSSKPNAPSRPREAVAGSGTSINAAILPDPPVALIVNELPSVIVNVNSIKAQLSADWFWPLEL